MFVVVVVVPSLLRLRNKTLWWWWLFFFFSFSSPLRACIVRRRWNGVEVDPDGIDGDE